MLQLCLNYLEKLKGYYPSKKMVKDEKLWIFWQFLDLVPPQEPDWLINELKDGLGGINIIRFEHEDGRVIIRDELDDPETGTYISIEENQLYEIIEKYAELACKKTPTIILTRDGENYGVEEG